MFRIGITASTFDLLHAGHISMLRDAKSQCDWLIAAIQTDPNIDRQDKNKPIQSIIERQIQVKGCRYVDEVIIYTTEKDLEDIFKMLPINVRILGEEYKHKAYTGKDICIERGIQVYYNKRDHDFSSSGLRKRIVLAEQQKTTIN